MILKINSIYKKYSTQILYILSFLLIEFSIDVGFSLKPYMFMILLIIILKFNSFKLYIKPFHSYEIWLILFLSYALIRNIFVSDIVLSTKGTVALMFSLIVYYFTKSLFYNINNKCIFRIINIAYMINTIFILLAYIFNKSMIYTIDRDVNRLKGFIQDPNFFNLYLCLSLFISVFLLIVYKQKKYLIFSIINIALIISTYSRTAYIAIIFGVLILIWNLRRYILNKKSLLIIGIMSYILISILSIYKNDNTNNETGVFNSVVNNINSRFTETASKNARQTLFMTGLDVIEKHPVFGVGMLNTRYYIPYTIKNNYLHNTYIDVFAEFGIIGFSLYMMFLISFILTRSNNKEAICIKVVVLCQLAQLFMLTGMNVEAYFLSMGIYSVVNNRNYN